MNKTLRTFIIIAAMLVATGQTWAALTTGTSYNLFVEPATGGTVTLYDNQGCTGDPITNAKRGNTVYLKAVPDIIHGYPTTSIITVEKIVDSGAAQSRGTRRISATTIGLGEYVEVTAVGQNTGIFSFTMPDDGASVSITVTFPDAPVSYINEAGQTVNTGNETVHILIGSETELDAGWYVAEGTLDYSQPITLSGDVHLILKDGAVMNVGTEQTPIHASECISGNDHSLSIYAQSTGGGKLNLYAISPSNSPEGETLPVAGIRMENGNLTINGGEVTTTGTITIDGGTLTLGWTGLTDFIKATSYSLMNNARVAIAEGKAFKVYDGESFVAFLGSGTLTSEQVAALGGKTLRPSRTSTLEAPQNLVASMTLAKKLTSARLMWQSDGEASSWQLATSTDGGTTWSSDVTVEEPAYSVMTELPEGNTLTVRVRSVYSETLCSDYATSTFNALSPVAYIDAEGNSQLCSAYTTLTGMETSIGIPTDTEGITNPDELKYEYSWYLASGNIGYVAGLTLEGDVHLILADGARVSFYESDEAQTTGMPYSIYGFPAKLNIYGQQAGSGVIDVENPVMTFGLTVNGGQLLADCDNVQNSQVAIMVFGDLTVNGGVVYSESDGTAIATMEMTPDSSQSTDIIINGGKVTAYGTQNGLVSGGDITINGGVVKGSGKERILFANGDITINGGQVTASNAAWYDFDEYDQDSDHSINLWARGNITLGWSKASDFIQAGKYYTKKGTVSIADGKTFCDDDGNIYSGTQTFTPNPDADPDDIYTLGTYAIDGKTLRPATPVGIALTDDATDNASVIEDNNEALTNVTLSGRTLYKDGAWNTLCLPFALSTEQVSTLLGSNGQLMELDTKGTYETDKKTGLDDTTLYLYFKAATTIAAGKPYIIRWEGNGGSDNLVDPVFTNVVIDADAPTEVSFTGGKFVGTYNWQEYTTENQSILFLGAGNTLYWPQPSGGNNPSIGACRAYFQLSPNANVREFVLNFDGNSEDTGIISISKESRSQGVADAWYSLDGVKLEGKPTKKGLYIHNGKKVVVK